MSTETTTQVASPETPQHTPRRIDEFLLEVVRRGGSDLHFVAGDPPRIRYNGELQSLRDAPLEKQLVHDTIMDFITRRALQQLEEKDGADFAYSIPGVSRFRVNVFRHIGGLGAVLRAIPSKALTLEQLSAPPVRRSHLATTRMAMPWLAWRVKTACMARWQWTIMSSSPACARWWR